MRLVVLVDDVVEPWLTTELVDALGNLVSGSVSQTGEKGEDFSEQGLGCGIPEDNRAQIGECNLRKGVGPGQAIEW